MSNKLSPGDRVSVDAGLGITKTGNVQRITESTVFVKHYNGAVVGYRTQHVTKMLSEEVSAKPRGVGLKSEFDAFMQVMEKTLTPAELKKREEVAKAMERENPDMPMDKKMAIATATAKKVAEETVEEAKAHTVPKTAKEKSLAAIAEPKDKITHADVMVGRGVKREGAMDMLKRVGSKVLDTLGHGDDEQMRKDIQKKMGVPQTGKPGMATQKEDVHYCAKHVFSERFGEGMVVEGQHAEPNEQGLIEWYDVDFGGTVRRVMTEKVKVMHAEYHMNHKKKMKEEDEIEEMSSKEKMKRGLYNKEEIELDEEQLDEVSKDTLLNYTKKASDSRVQQKRPVYKRDRSIEGEVKAHKRLDKMYGEEVEINEAETGNLPGQRTHIMNKDVRHPEHGIISNGTVLRHTGGNNFEVRAGRAKGKIVNIPKEHVNKLDEEVDLDEAMISYSDFQSKIAAHQKAGNQIKDDKYDKKKASYTVIDKEGTAKKITHTDSGVSQQHLGSVKRDDDESSETTSTEKRGRGRPAGSKSGARN